MPIVRVFDPAMCCATGVCGPGVDPELARFAADVAWAVSQGADIERYNLAQQPQEFAASEVVREAIAARGVEVLPLVLVDGRVAAEGTYPSRDALAALAGIVVRKLGVAGGGKRSCGPSGCC